VNYNDLVSLQSIIDLKTSNVIDAFRCCAVVSKISLFKNYKEITQDDIDAEWGYEDISPSWEYIRRIIKISNIKWYIKNYMDVSDRIWNGDFIHGISSAGVIKTGNKSFPSLHWNCNEDVLYYIKNSPFSGNLYSFYPFYRWGNVSAFYLKSEKDSLSYLSGALATGKRKVFDGKVHASYSKKSIEIIRGYGIPVLYSSKGGKQNFISVFWPALLTPSFNDVNPWMFIYNCDKKAEEYASVLWRHYISYHKIDVGKIPHLPSKSTVQRKYGTIRNNQRLWFSNNLTQLDSKIIAELVRQANMESVNYE
jgi:hypothetical protein